MITVTYHVVSVVLIQQNQLEMHMRSAMGHFNMAANIGIKNSCDIKIVYQCFKIFLMEKKAGGSAVIDRL